jgi:hypothetical protein
MRDTIYDTRTRSRFADTSITAAFIFALTALPAFAVPLDPITLSGNLNAVADNQGDPVTITTFGSYTSTKSGLSGSAANGSATVTGGADPSVSITGSITVPPSSGGGGTAATAGNLSLTYQFAIDSAISQSVMLTVGVTGAVNTGGINEFFQLGSLSANANAGISSTMGLIRNISCGVSATGCSNGFVGGNFLVNTNQAYSVTLNVNTLFQASSFTNSFPETLTVSASIDPMMSLDPLLNPGLDLSQFSFEFSSGLFPTAGDTPLPAALPLFTSGLGGLGLLGWRRKRKALAAA